MAVAEVRSERASLASWTAMRGSIVVTLLESSYLGEPHTEGTPVTSRER
jgi:hypothetical protein